MCTQALRAVLLTLAILGSLAAGCDSDDDDDASKGQTGTTATETKPAEPKRDLDEARKRAKRQKRAKKRETKSIRRRAESDIRAERRAARREEARDRREDREFDEAFEGTSFERVLAELPIRRPPLYVQQYVTTEGSHKVYTAVARKRFFCGRTPARRRGAVAAFYRAAARRFRRARIDDFVQVVTLPGDTVGDARALAIARDGKVRLTARGRRPGRC